MKKKCLELLFDEVSKPGMKPGRHKGYFDVLLQFVKHEGFEGMSNAEVWALTQAAKRRSRLPELERAVRQRLAGSIAKKE